MSLTCPLTSSGTILHEWLHGVGVIPWADTEWSRHTLRSGVNNEGYGTGNWLGDRVSAVLDFLQDTFTLDGRRMPDNNGLRPGLYIINGRKTVIK